MARIDNPILPFTTSPRTPEKMIPEIDLLARHFTGQKWNKDSQRAFMGRLAEEQFFHGEGAKDPSFSARDRINRAPKALGFVLLKPHIQLTQAGKELLSAEDKQEVFLRQILKYQIPSPYHKSSHEAADFRIKPYLEMLRLVRTLGTLKFEELQIFGMQLTDYRDFDIIVKKIKEYRAGKVKHEGSHRRYKAETLRSELQKIFRQRISSGKIKTRESNEKTLEKFLNTQANNMRDYADACFRYLRATGLVNVSHIGKSLSIVKEREEEVDYILRTVSREPCFTEEEEKYTEYLGNATLPELMTDNKQLLIKLIRQEFPDSCIDTSQPEKDIKTLLQALRKQRKEKALEKQVKALKDYRLYDDIQQQYAQIHNIYDAPLVMEWNTWRAMIMLDGGNIKANLKFDDFGMPLSTAQGNMADIVCDYEDYILTVEVTMASGQRQYEMEGEPVSRHLGKIKTSTKKDCYCLFIAPTINESCIAHFYSLYYINISYYGGKSVIVPLPLNVFMKMLEDSYMASYTPSPDQVRRLFTHARSLAMETAANNGNEKDWYEALINAATHWLELE